MKSSYSLIALAGTLTLGVVCFNGSANAQASSDTSDTVAGQAKSGEPSSGAGRAQTLRTRAEQGWKEAHKAKALPTRTQPHAIRCPD